MNLRKTQRKKREKPDSDIIEHKFAFVNTYSGFIQTNVFEITFTVLFRNPKVNIYFFVFLSFSYVCLCIIICIVHCIVLHQLLLIVKQHLLIPLFPLQKTGFFGKRGKYKNKLKKYLHFDFIYVRIATA